MKKLLSIFCVIALMGAFSMACNGKGERETQAVSSSAEVAAFFDEHLMEIRPLERIGNVCLAFNSMDELREIIPLPTELPVIDFVQHTLIIGRYWAVNGCSIQGHSIDDVESKKIVLNLKVERLTDGYYMETEHYYWGLYPKLPPIPIEVNVSFINN